MIMVVILMVILNMSIDNRDSEKKITGSDKVFIIFYILIPVLYNIVWQLSKLLLIYNYQFTMAIADGP